MLVFSQFYHWASYVLTLNKIRQQLSSLLKILVTNQVNCLICFYNDVWGILNISTLLVFYHGTLRFWILKLDISSDLKCAASWCYKSFSVVLVVYMPFILSFSNVREEVFMTYINPSTWYNNGAKIALITTWKYPILNKFKYVWVTSKNNWPRDPTTSLCKNYLTIRHTTEIRGPIKDTMDRLVNHSATASSHSHFESTKTYSIGVYIIRHGEIIRLLDTGMKVVSVTEYNSKTRKNLNRYFEQSDYKFLPYYGVTLNWQEYVELVSLSDVVQV